MSRVKKETTYTVELTEVEYQAITILLGRSTHSVLVDAYNNSFNYKNDSSIPMITDEELVKLYNVLDNNK